MTVRIANYQAIRGSDDNVAGNDAVSSSDAIVVINPDPAPGGNGNGHGHVDTSSTKNSTSRPPSIVFESPAKYHICTVFLLALAPAATLGSLALAYLDKTVSYEDRRSITHCLLWATAVIIIVYSLVLPKRFEVLSDASIRVVMWTSLTHTFPNATAAYHNPPMNQNLFRPKLKFATDLNSRVVVTRRNEGWDLLVSLHDAPGFVAAVWQVAGEVEARIGII
jgi:hypothetical protein